MNGPLNIAANSGIDGLEITQSGSGEALSITGGNAIFGDNDKAVFGAGSDLQIYHDGSASYIDDAGTGNLRIRANSSLSIQKYTGETMGVFTADGSVLLAHDNATKFETTSTGIQVTGTVTADGLTVGIGDYLILDGGSSGEVIRTPVAGTLTLESRGSVDIYGDSNNNGTATSGIFTVYRDSTYAGGTAKTTLNITDNGDISFYEDTGTTPKFFWDASAESLGIGTTSPDGGLDIEKTVNTAWSSALRANDFLQISNVSTTGGSYSGIELIATGVGAAGAAEIVCIDSGSGSGDLAFSTRNSSTWSEKVRILAGGNVGIGNTSPDSVLEVNLTTSGSGANDNTAGSSIGVGSSATAQPILGMRWTGASHVGISGNAFSTQIVNDTANSNAFEMYTTGASPLVFGTAATERMRIDSSGSLLHGTTSSSLYNATSGDGVNTLQRPIPIRRCLLRRHRCC
jgi:hypothetical protein